MSSVRKRMKQLARGKFEYAKTKLIFSEKQIEFTVMEDSEYGGSFLVQAENGKKIRGIVYSTHPRMECLTPQFEGEEVRIRYQFHSRGLVEGLKETGDFVIVCEQCEVSLSFCVQISKEYLETKNTKVKNLYDFSCLAKEHWEEAYQFFYHKNFSNIIKANEVKEQIIYRGMMGAKPSFQNLEEFLVGIRKKEKIHLSIDKTNIELFDVQDIVKENIEIKKDHWGYVELIASCEDDFISIEKDKITSFDFIGSTCTFGFFVDANKMHGGNNYARIYLNSAYESLCIDIVATKASKKEESVYPPGLQKKDWLAGIMELYQAYRLKRIVTGVWANDTIDILEHLHALEPEEPMHVLMKAQCLIINRQRQEAEWILDEFKKEWLDRKDPVWGYYLYIMTLIEREPTYVDRLTKEIELIFHENPDSVLLFWVLLFLEEKYFNNNALKLKDIEYWVRKGCSSPYLYLEAYYLIWQEPYLLEKLGKFEVQVLRWAVRRRAITKDISIQIFHIMEVSKGFDPILYELLCAAYEANPKPEHLGIICSYLIKAQKYDNKYHGWFEQGIELELRITGLYEAYLLSMDERTITPIPQIIQMYFQYESELPFKKMAVLYNNIIASKNTNPETYQKYRRIMGKFAMEQVEKGHMDDNLAVVYEDMLDLGLVNEEIARALAQIVFTKKIAVFDKKMVRAIIYQKQLRDPQIVPIVEQAAYFQLYSKDYVILFEDEKGRRYVGDISYQLQNLMDSQKYLEKCMSLAEHELPYLIAYFDKKHNYLTFSKEDKKYFSTIMNSPFISKKYKAQMLPEILRFYQINAYDGMVEEYLKSADFAELDSVTRKYVLELMVDNHLFDYAYDKINYYGIDQIGSSAKVSLASYMIDYLNGEEDEFLVLLAQEAFFSKKYNNKILDYLAKYYNGPTQKMLSLWNALCVSEQQSFELAERILVQMLYAEERVSEGFHAFGYYYEHGGDELVVLAYLTVSAHDYFVKETKIEADLIRIIESRIDSYTLELNDACKLAVLFYYSQSEFMSEKQLEIEDLLLAEYTRRNMNFAFYKRLDQELLLKYHLYDKVFLEYRANPHSHVCIHYSRDEDGENFIKEDMLDIYDGIFVKSFIMFFGETIQYYISEEYEGKVQVSESNRIVNNDVYSKNDGSRYSLLNQMLISNTLMDETTLYHSMKEYKGFHEVTQQIFKVL